MSTRLYNQIRTEAYEVLMTCTNTTQRELVAWAAGVWSGCHALTFARLPVRVGDLAPEHHGSAGGGRNILATRSGVQVSRFTESDLVPVTSVTWPEVTALVTRRLVGPELHAEIREALALRVELTDRFDPTRPRSWQPSPAEMTRRHGWAENEIRCYDLGAQVWDRCRPGEQLELFELLEVAG